VRGLFGGFVLANTQRQFVLRNQTFDSSIKLKRAKMTLTRAIIGGTLIMSQKSRVIQLMAPEKLEIKDIQTSLGRTRVFWARKDIKTDKEWFYTANIRTSSV
jgi:hypothetical protein